MTELGPELSEWLRSLKLAKEPTSLQDFANGFLFGEVFSKLHLRRNKNFHNKQDLTCTFQNYKTTKELIRENWGIEVPADNLINRAKDLLLLIKAQATKQQQQLGTATAKSGTRPLSQSNKPHTLNNNSISSGGFDPYSSLKKELDKQLNTTMAQKQIGFTSKFLPKKIIEIESKLQKFRDEKVKHQIVALEERRRELDLNSRMIQDHREYQRNKLRNNHEFIKTMDEKIYQGWRKSESIKAQRMDRERKFDQFMASKKEAVKQAIRQQDEDGFRQGLETFSTNCMKLGIDLQKDLNKVMQAQKEPKEERNFNQVAFLERIRDQNQRREEARKDKIKRENNMRIEQKDTQAKAEALFAEQQLVEKYASLVVQQAKQCQEVRRQEAANAFEHQRRKDKAMRAKVSYNIVFDEAAEKARQEEYNVRRIQYMQENLEEKIRKREKHNNKIQEVLAGILQIVQDCFAQQKRNSKAGEQSLDVPYRFWVDAVSKFVEGSSLDSNNLNKSLSAIPAVSRNKLSVSNAQLAASGVDLGHAISSAALAQYLTGSGEWISSAGSTQQQQLKNQGLSPKLTAIIQLAHPDKEAPARPVLPLHMPLKVALVGSTLSGRKTQADKLAKKYGLVVINPYQIVREALQLVTAPPPEDNKKGAKKDAKKPQDDTPNPKKQIMLEFGTRIKEAVSSADQATSDLLLEAFTIRLKQSFIVKTPQDTLQDFKQAEKSSATRYAQALAEYQEAQKKKKDPKKPAQPEQPPQEPKYPYTQGFVLVGLRDEHLRDFERVIGGYIPDSERINQDAEKFKEECGVLVGLPPRKVQTTLMKGVLDFVFVLDAPEQVLNARNEGRKLDPVTNTIYHPTFNPPPTDVKGLVERLVPVDRVPIQEFKLEAAKALYQKHGFQEPQINTLQIVPNPTQMPIDDIHKAIDEKVDALLAYKTARFRNGQTTTQPQAAEDLHRKRSSPILGQLLGRMKQTVKSYKGDLQQSLSRLVDDRTQFLHHYQDVIKSFLDILVRPDDKMIKILSFQDTYNKLLSEQEGLLQIQQAKSHLIDKLDALYDGMWDSICAKKDEALHQRSAILASAWLETECSAVVNSIQRTLQIELNRATQLIEFAISVELAETGAILESAEHIPIDSVSPDSDKLPPCISTDPEIFPRLKQLQLNLDKVLGQLKGWARHRMARAVGAKEEVKLGPLQPIVNEQTEKMRIRGVRLLAHAASRLREYRALYNLLAQRTDDWIIYGIKNENDSTYACVKKIKQCINEGKKSNVRQIPNTEIQELYKPYPHISPTHLPTFSTLLEHKRMVVEDMKSLYQRWDQHRIPYPLFKEYLQRRMKAKLLPSYITREVQFDLVEQYFVQNNCLDGFEISITLLLYEQDMPLDEEIENYRTSLKNICETKSDNALNTSNVQGGLPLSSFLGCPAWFQTPGQSLEENLGLKHLLFEIFRNPECNEIDVDKLCDTLVQLSQMQVSSFHRLLSS